MKARTLYPGVIVRDGKPVAVILDIEEYREILERLEDAEDLREDVLYAALLQPTRGLGSQARPRQPSPVPPKARNLP